MDWWLILRRISKGKENWQTPEWNVKKIEIVKGCPILCFIGLQPRKNQSLTNISTISKNA